MAAHQRIEKKGPVVITGVSSGIGEGLCRELVTRGYRVFGSVRKPEDAERLQSELGGNFSPLLFDVTDHDGVRAGARTVAETLGDEPLAALVNNAGVSVLGPLQLLSLERYREQFEVNVLGMIAVTQAFLPLLGARPDFRGTPGRIVNISSTYGVLSYPLMSPYSGSKHAIEGVTGCLRAELKAYGIDVILVGPGPVKSRIWRKNEALDFTYARGTRYEEPIRRLLAMQDKGERYGMSEARLGRRLRKIIESRHPRARYAPVVFSLYLWVLPRITPPWLLDRITARQLGL